MKYLRLAIFTAVLSLLSSSGNQAHAYSQTRLMDDQIMNNVSALSTSQVGDFLAGRSGPYTAMSRPSPCLSNYSNQNFHWDGSRWHYGNDSDWNTAWGSSQIPAYVIIAQAGQMWGVNPEAIMATIEKEESLISGSSCDGWRYNSAMGYACPDSGGCNPKYAGFTKQVLWGTYQLEFGLQRSYGNTGWDGDDNLTYVGYMTQGNRARCGGCAVNYYDGYASIDGQSVYMENGATASLYSYTPHLGNSTPRIFEQWFGSALIPSYSWEPVSTTYSRGNSSIPAAEKETITLVAKNVGTATWTNNGSFPVYLGLYNHTSPFYDPSWTNQGQVVLMQESSVAPGSNGTFVFTIQAPTTGSYVETFHLVAVGKTWLSGPGFQTGFNVSATNFSAQYVSDTFPAGVQAGDTAAATVTYKNTGTTTWYKSGSAVPKLGTYGHNSIFANNDWPSPDRAAVMNENTVGPGQNATFSFNIRGPDVPRTATDTFMPIIEGWAWVQAPFDASVNIQGTYFAQPSQATYNISIPAGESYSTVVNYTNTGSATWANSGMPTLKLATANPNGRSSAFANGWPAPNRADVLNQASVAPDGTGSFTLSLKAPLSPGNYTESFTPIAEGVAWLNAPVTFNITVLPPSYTWQMVGQTFSVAGGSTTALNAGDVINAEPGDSISLNLTAKNTGNTTWGPSIDFPTKLGLWTPETSSRFTTGSWPAPNRAASIGGTVAPNANGTFALTLQAPYPGDFTEYFNAVAEGRSWFNDIGATYRFHVRGNYSSQLVSRSCTVGSQTFTNGTCPMATNATATMTIVMKNTGDVTWRNSGPVVTKLATSGPRGRSSSFYQSSWPAIDRPAVMSEGSVAPNANGTFTFTAHAPMVTGSYHEPFNLIAEGITWFGGPDAAFDFSVN
jgi:hypothetical protein